MSLRVLLVLCLCVCLGSCSAPPPPFRVGTNVWAGYELLYLARDEGLYPEGIKLVELASASDVMDALRAGQLEAGGLTLDETLTLVQEGIDMAIVLVFDISAGADVMMVHPDIGTLADLKGETIAVETTALGALMLKGVLEAANLGIDDVTIRHLSLREHLEAYQNGDVRAAITFAPYDSALAAAGAKRGFDSRAIKGQIVDVLAIRRDALDQQGHALKTLISGYYRARMMLDSQPDDALARINRRLKLPASELPHAYDGLELPSLEETRTLLSGTPSPLQVSAGSLAALMVHHKLLPGAPSVTGITDPAWLPVR